MTKAKVTKIMIWPSRTVGLPNYGSVKLNAGLELEFDKPVSLKSKEVKKVFDEARGLIREEFKRQFEPYEGKVKVK